MKRRLSILLAAGFVLIRSVGVYWQRNVDHRSSFLIFEPRQEGESLSYWVLHLYYYDQGRHVNYAAQEALLHIGTNALPLLLDWISRPDPKFYVPGKIEYQRHAIDGFEILGPMAMPAIPRLVKNVGEGSEYSMQALELIGRDAVPALADKLLETLADKGEPVTNWRDPDYKKNFFHVQACILGGLGRMGTNAEAAIPAVLKAMNANQAGRVSGWRWPNANACWTLTGIGRNHPEIVVPALIAALTNSAASNPGAAARAMASFATDHSDDFLPALINTINNQQTDDANRREMAGAMAVVGRRHPELVVPALIEAFTNTDLRYRDGIAEALGVFAGDARPALPLLSAASTSPYFYLREKAAIAIKQIAPERTKTLSVLTDDLNNPEPAFRQQTIYALGRLGTNGVEAVPALLRCLSHPDPQTRIDAMRALGQIGVASDEFIVDLGENLAHTNSFVCSEAYSALGRFAGRSRLSFMMLVRKGMNGPISSDVRQQVKWILVDAARSNPTFLLECLDHPDPQVRSSALLIFYELGRRIPESVAPLRRMAANDPDSSTRSFAADILRMQDR